MADPPPRLPQLTGPLSTLAPPEVDRLVASGTWADHPAGTELLEQGSDADEVHFVATGSVRVVFTRPDGRRLLLGMRGPGTVLGDLSVVGDARRSASVTAIDDVTTLQLTGDDFLRFLVDHPTAMFAMLRDVGRRLRQAERRLADVGGHSPKVRLARQLLEHATGADARLDDDGLVSLQLDTAAAAEWIRATADEADEAMRSLQQAGLVSSWGTGCKLTDVEGLRVVALM